MTITKQLVPFYIECSKLTNTEMRKLWDTLVATDSFDVDEIPRVCTAHTEGIPHDNYLYFGTGMEGTLFEDDSRAFGDSTLMTYHEALSMLTANPENTVDISGTIEGTTDSSHDHTLQIQMGNLDSLLAQRAKDLRAELDTFLAKSEELKALDELIAKRSNF